MDSFGDIIKHHLQPYFVRRYQGVEDRSVKELLHLVVDGNPQVRSEIVRGIVKHFADAPLDSRRLEHIDRMKKLDNVEWAQGIEPGIPAVDHTLESFYFRPKWPDVAEARANIEGWLRRSGPRLLTLSGPVGCGKSHLAIAAARELAGRGDPVIYREEFHMITELQNGVRSNTTEAILQELMGVPWLVIDDLGLSPLSDWSRGILERLINSRWENARVKWTLITTNLLSQDLSPRIGSRLADKTLARALTINASDYRRELRKPSTKVGNHE